MTQDHQLPLGGLDEEVALRTILEATGWRVSGENGAAQLVGMNPSTMASRMKALGIKRPPQA